MRTPRFRRIRGTFIILGTAATFLAAPRPADPAAAPSHSFTVLGHSPLGRIVFYDVGGDPPPRMSNGTGSLALENDAAMPVVVKRRYNARKDRSTYTFKGKDALVGTAYSLVGPIAVLKGRITTSGVGPGESVAAVRFTFRILGTEPVKTKVSSADDVTLASAAGSFALGSGETGVFLSLVLSRSVSEDCSLWRYGLPCEEVVSANETMVLFRPSTSQSGIVWPTAKRTPFLRSANGGLYVGVESSWSAWDLDFNEFGAVAAHFDVNAPYEALATGDYFLLKARGSSAYLDYRMYSVDMRTGASNDLGVREFRYYFGDGGRLFFFDTDDHSDVILEELDPWTAAPIGSALHFDLSAYFRIYMEMDGGTVYLLGERGATSDPYRGTTLDLLRLSGSALQPILTVNLGSDVLSRTKTADYYDYERNFDIAGNQFIYRAWDEGFLLTDIDALQSWTYDIGAPIKDMAIVRRP